MFPLLFSVTFFAPLLLIRVVHPESGSEWFAVLDESIGSDSKASMMVALMDALYSALRIFIPDPEVLPLLVHKQVRGNGTSNEISDACCPT